MTSIFSYGTLMDRDLLSAILGHDLDSSQLKPAVLENHRAVCIAGASFPALVQDNNHNVTGMLITGLSRNDLKKIEYYEAGLYVTRDIDVTVTATGDICSALCYYEIVAPGFELIDETWSLEDWQRNKKPYLFKVQEVLTSDDLGTKDFPA